MPSDVVFPADAPRPRLCHLIKWPDFDGYGFNLHAEKVRSGQYIGKVDAGSPAESAGLRQGDRIIEVNGVNIANENHKQVVERIKAVSNETKLLVLDSVAEKYYLGGKKTYVVKSTQSNVLALKTPVPRPGATPATPESGEGDADSLDGGGSATGSAGGQADDSGPRRNGHKVKNGSLGSASEADERRSHASSINSDNDADKLSRHGSSTVSTPPADRMDQLSFGKTSPTSQSSMTPPTTPNGTTLDKKSPSPSPSPSPTDDGPAGRGAVNNALNLNMTVSEMRAMLAQRKRRDPKMEGLDFRMKHDIVQGM